MRYVHLVILFALAASALLPPEIASELRCVATIAVARDPAVANDGAFYAAIVGASAMDATGASREAVRDLIIAQVRIVERTKPAPASLTACLTQMRARLALEKIAP